MIPLPVFPRRLCRPWSWLYHMQRRRGPYFSGYYRTGTQFAIALCLTVGAAVKLCMIIGGTVLWLAWIACLSSGWLALAVLTVVSAGLFSLTQLTVRTVEGKHSK